MIESEAASAVNRRRLIRIISADVVRPARTLAIANAARGAHHSACHSGVLECEICRTHAMRVTEAKFALRRDAFS